ncbi:20S proteasome, regulatory subunit beta type PSMB7/PSMB10/PUP1 [Pseudoloma neurophilia]|uniref:proteasome endopeptidase complex n=1 Tax=Pseudoloma neurophilia TaxID=146866 RepID=A0A0R0LT63_9MICR|nr:20S proteasome, regulatory subunit beta type PSMB7/PSMB10/PUP1 [Pseudoloma neurophilia]
MHPEQEKIITENKNLLKDAKINPLKTGTTIVGVQTDNCVVLAADTRATNGPIVFDKHCFKLHKISDEIYCAGAGTAADTDRVTEYCASMIRIFENKYRKKAPVKYAVNIISKHLFNYGGFISAAIILAGKYRNKFYLYSISPDGTITPGPYQTMGSGTLAAISVLESHYSPSITNEQACELAANAVKAGILNDLYSGSNVDLVLLDTKTTKVTRNFMEVSASMTGKPLKYDPNSIKITKEEIWNYIEEVNDH